MIIIIINIIIIIITIIIIIIIIIMVFINHSLRKQTCNNLHGKKSEKYIRKNIIRLSNSRHG